MKKHACKLHNLLTAVKDRQDIPCEGKAFNERAVFWGRPCASGDVTVSGNLSIFDLSGKNYVQELPVTFGNNQVDLDNLPTGLYFVTVTTKDGQVFRQKLVIFK